MSESTKTEIAQSLRHHLFGDSYSAGMIGIGADRFHAYIFASESNWRGNKPTEWHGEPVEYHWRVGRPRTFASSLS